MNTTILWLNPKTSLHTYGIHVLSYSESMAIDIMQFIKKTCIATDTRYFIQGQDFHPGKNWLFVEFFGEENHDKILNVIDRVNAEYHNYIFAGEVLCYEPSRESLELLGLF